MPVELRRGLVIPDAELSFRFTPSGGPGGQHANRSNTRVELRWDVAGSRAIDEATRQRLLSKLGPVVQVVADDERSQARNRELALGRLRQRIDAALQRPKRRRKTRPSKASQRRRVDAKVRRGRLKNLRRRPPVDD